MSWTDEIKVPVSWLNNLHKTSYGISSEFMKERESGAEGTGLHERGFFLILITALSVTKVACF